MIVDKIRRKREQHGYSQEYMAERLGMSQNAYSRMEKGETKLDIDRLRGIADVLEANIEEFLSPDTVVVNTHDQQGGASGYGYHVVNHQNGLPEDMLRTISDRYEAHVQELHQLNDRLLALLERLTEGSKA